MLRLASLHPAFLLVAIAGAAGCGDVPLFVSADVGADDADAEGPDGAAAPCVMPLPPQCTGEGAPRVCFEGASGCPGDTVEVRVHVEVNGACGDVGDQGGGFLSGPFELVNAVGIDGPAGDCLRRETVDGTIEWARLSSGTIPDGCPSGYGTGVVDALRLRIPEDLAPGDYALEARWGLVQSSMPTCATMEPATAPTIRVGSR